MRETKLRPDGETGRQRCVFCRDGRYSLAGLRAGNGLCGWHFAYYVHGWRQARGMHPPTHHNRPTPAK